jgi:hypothetical protein
MGLNFAIYETLKLTTESFLINLEKFKNKDYKLNSNNISIDGSSSSNNNDNNDSFKRFLTKGFCGGIAGGASKFIVYPLDTIKKRLQSQVLLSTATTSISAIKYNGILHCAQTIYKSEGILGFYKGIVPTVFKAVTATAITFAVYDTTKELIVKRRKLFTEKDKE